MEMKLFLFTSCFLLLHSKTWGLTDNEISQFKCRTHVEQNTGLQGTVSVKIAPKNSSRLILQANGIPDHDTGTFPNSDNPNSIEAQSYNWRIDRNPVFIENGGTACLPMGPIAMSINGVAMYNPYTITCCDAGQEELDLFDMCTGHPGPSGQYHYHIYPTCLEDIICETPSGILGVAFDGFPIYGPIDENGRQLTKADLDECNGRTDSAGFYKYHIIKEFPYIMGCYRGKVIDNSITSNCQCTEPVEVCTEFGGGTGGGGGGGRPPPPPHPGRKKRATDEEFTCCTDEQSCSQSRIFVHDATKTGDGNGSPSTRISLLVFVLTIGSLVKNIV